jgi:hypothetical protein
VPTPIEQARNIGPLGASELRSIGNETVEDLRSVGWQEAFVQLFEAYPERLELNAATALIGGRRLRLSPASLRTKSGKLRNSCTRRRVLAKRARRSR